MIDICPICQNKHSQTFFRLTGAPVSIGVQWPSAEQARACGKGDLHLGFCPSCGFIWNQAFDSNRLEYSQRYDNSLDFSSVFQKYAQTLAHRLVESYDIRKKKVLELGCGKGHFLTLLCEAGENHGIGFDPSFEGSRLQSPAAERITYVADFYGEKYTQHQGDLICCRHVFEHIPDPVAFLSMVRRTIGDRRSTIVYFEVPNVRFILQQHSIWDIIYEHCNYFSRESLAYTFRAGGFEVVRLEESFGGQFLSLEARLADQAGKGHAQEVDTADLAANVAQFAEEVRERSRTWEDQLKRIRRERQRVVIWGGGAKAVSFLNMLKIGEEIPYVVDINPHKQGRHLPGTGQKIVAPEFLPEFQPQLVILMNPIYRKEVGAQLKKLNVAAKLLDA